YSERAVGEEQAALLGVGRRLLEEGERQRAQALRRRLADDRAHAFEVDVLVVSGRGLGGRREDRLGQAAALDEPRRQLHPADGARLLVLLESRAREVAARHALDGERIAA